MNCKLLSLLGGIAIAAGTIGGAVGAWIGAPDLVDAAARRPSGVETNELRLIDDQGNVRGILGLDNAGNPLLSFLDETGTVRLWTGVTTDGIAMLNLRDHDGEGGVFVKVAEDGPVLWFTDEDGNTTYKQR